MNQLQKRQRVIVFDVNETLLDIDRLIPFFERRFGDAHVMRQRFAERTLYAQALTSSGGYAPFGQIAVAVLKIVAEIGCITLQEGSIDEFKGHMVRVPAHQDAAPALDKRNDAGFRLVTLTNSVPDAGGAVLERAGSGPYFERQFSVDDVKRFKPLTSSYRSVEAALGVDAGALRLVAAHPWDTLGAAAGSNAAPVTRPGSAPPPLGEQPDIVEKDWLAVAERVVRTDA